MPDYSAILKEFEDDLARAMTDRDALSARIDALLTAIEAIKALAETSDNNDIQAPLMPERAGFTEKVRNLLRVNAAKSFSPVEIRDVLLDYEKDADPKVMLIHVHNTVKRLHKQGELQEINRPDGKGYRFASVMAKERMDQIRQQGAHFLDKGDRLKDAATYLKEEAERLGKAKDATAGSPGEAKYPRS